MSVCVAKDLHGRYITTFRKVTLKKEKGIEWVKKTINRNETINRNSLNISKHQITYNLQIIYIDHKT